MIAGNLSPAASECERILELLARFPAPSAAPVLGDAQEIRRLLSLYSFRAPARAEQRCAQIASRYRAECLFLYGAAALSHRQSESCYLRLEQLLSLLARIAMLRLCRSGVLPFSPAQLTLSDGLLLVLLEKEAGKRQMQTSGVPQEGIGGRGIAGSDMEENGEKAN